MKLSSRLNHPPVNDAGGSPDWFTHTVLKHTCCPRRSLLALVLPVVVGFNPAQGYEDYGGCASCHGDLRGSTSSKGTIFPNNHHHDIPGVGLVTTNYLDVGGATKRARFYRMKSAMP